MIFVPQVDRAEFVAYWAKWERERDAIEWRTIRPYILYLGWLIVYGVVARWLDPEGDYVVLSFGIAVAYVVLSPYLWVRSGRARRARCGRCRACGDWFGHQDASGAYSGPNPKYRAVIATGRCGRCGAVVLTPQAARQSS